MNETHTHLKQPERNTSPQNSAWRALKCPEVPNSKTLVVLGHLSGVKVSVKQRATEHMHSTKAGKRRLPSCLKVILVCVECWLVWVLEELYHTKQLHEAVYFPKPIYANSHLSIIPPQGKLSKQVDVVWCGVCADMTICLCLMWFISTSMSH